MIRAEIFKSKVGNTSYKGFRLSGHADYAESGKDIICAAVSALVINTVNSLEKFTDDVFTCKTNEDEGIIEINFYDSCISNEARLLIDSMVSGLLAIEKERGFLEVNFKEV